MSATAELTAFACDLKPGDLKHETIQQTKRCVLDLLGVALAGSRTPMAQAGARFGLAQFGPGQATGLGFPGPLNPLGATWVNGISASALDLDDGHREAMGHPGASVIPAALAMAETVGASGQLFLAAVVAGYEVAVRVSKSRRPAYKERQYSTGIWGGFGAATAAAKVLQLDAQAIEHSLGIAFAHVPFPGSGVNSRMVKEGIGWAGVSGCAAALMAEQGFEGPADAFDQYARHDPDELVRDLGKNLVIQQVYFKPHASCRWSHPAVDGILELVRRDHIRPEDVEAVSVAGFYEVTRLANKNPTTMIAAQFSIPFCVALALTYGRVGPAEVADANLHNPQIMSLAQKVSVTIDPDLDREFPAKTMTRVAIRTCRGEFTSLIEYPKGNAENPLTEVELLAKFRSLAMDILGEERVAGLKEAVEHMDGIGNMRDFTRLLAV